MQQTFEERFTAQKKQLVERIIKAFNEQTGATIDPSVTDVVYSRPTQNMVLSLTIITARTDDHVRIRFDVRAVGETTDFGRFELQLKKNHSSASLDDETYVTNGVLANSEFPDIFSYRNTKEYRDFIASKPRIITMSGQELCYAQGNPVETQC